MSKVRERLEQLKRDLENHTIYKEGLPGSALDIVNALLEDLAADEKENGWTPVTERPPKPSKRYLVSAIWEDDGYTKESIYDAVYGSDGLWHSHEYRPVHYRVIAWRPLPKPYKEVK